MLYNSSLLSAADQAAWTAALAGIPAVLTPLSAAIAQAQTTGAQALSLAAQMASLEAQRAALLAPGGGAGPQDPPVVALTQQKLALAGPLQSADVNAASVNHSLYAACQNANGLLSTLLPIALRQATAEVSAALAPFFLANDPELTATARVTGLHGQLHAVFNAATQPAPNSLAVTVAIATGLQTLLQAIEAGTAFVTLG